MMAIHGRKGWVATLIALALTLTACGNAQERSMCRQYEDLKEVAAQFEELDPATATAADVLALVEDFTVQLDQFQAASEGLYDQAVSNLNFSLAELRQVSFDLGDEPLEVARPLMEDSWESSVTGYDILKQRLDVVCGTD